MMLKRMQQRSKRGWSRPQRKHGQLRQAWRMLTKGQCGQRLSWMKWLLLFDAVYIEVVFFLLLCLVLSFYRSRTETLKSRLFTADGVRQNIIFRAECGVARSAVVQKTKKH